jgi:hypothetical protein
MLIVRDAFFGRPALRAVPAAARDFPQCPQPVPHLAGRPRRVRDGAVLRAPAAPRVQVDRQGPGPVAGSNRHAPVGRQVRGPRRTTVADRPQGLRQDHRSREDLCALRRTRQRPRRSGGARRAESRPAGPVRFRRVLLSMVLMEHSLPIGPPVRRRSPAAGLTPALRALSHPARSRNGATPSPAFPNCSGPRRPRARSPLSVGRGVRGPASL